MLMLTVTDNRYNQYATGWPTNQLCLACMHPGTRSSVDTGS